MRLKIALTILLACLCSPLIAQHLENYTQYVPAAAAMGLGIAGAESQNTFVGRAFEVGISFASEVVIVEALKHAVSEERPDGSDFDSFPSGHTATAFMGAEIVRIEYGNGWGAGAYALAASVAVCRVCHDRHFWWDTLAGAGCGFAAAKIGSLLAKPAMNLTGLGKKTKELCFSPSFDPISGAPTASFAMIF